MDSYGKQGEIVRKGTPLKALVSTIRVEIRLDPKQAYVLDKVIVPALGRGRTYAFEWFLEHFEDIQAAGRTVAAFKQWEAADAAMRAAVAEVKE